MKSTQPRRTSTKKRTAAASKKGPVIAALAAIGALSVGAVYLDARHPAFEVANVAPAPPQPVKRPAAPPVVVASAAPQPATPGPQPARDAIATMLAGPTASVAKPAKMTPAAWRDLDAALLRAIDACWTKPNGVAGFAPKIRIDFNRDGALSARPTLLNPPADAAAGRAAQTAADALSKCKDLAVPSRFLGAYDQWRTRVIHLDSAA